MGQILHRGNGVNVFMEKQEKEANEILFEEEQTDLGVVLGSLKMGLEFFDASSEPLGINLGIILRIIGHTCFTF